MTIVYAHTQVVKIHNESIHNEGEVLIRKYEGDVFALLTSSLVELLQVLKPVLGIRSQSHPKLWAMKCW